MILSDIADKIYIDPRKLTHYVLDPNSPHGKYKAVLFEKLLGFTKDNHTSLIFQIQSTVMRAEIVFHSEDSFGKRYTADISIEGSKNRNAVVRTGWIIAPGSRVANLVTLYVKEKI